MSYLNKAIDQGQRRKVKKQAVLQNAQLIILLNDENRIEKQKEIFKRLKVDFQSLFKSSTCNDVSPYLKRWIDSVLQSGIQKVCPVTKRFPNHFQGVGQA